MRRHMLGLAGAALSGLLLAGCAQQAGSDSAGNGNGNGNGHSSATVHRIEPGPEAQDQAQTALIECADGDIIEFAEGTFEFNSTLSMEDKRRVTIRGAGMEKTILNFKGMGPGTGGEGIKITGSNTDLVEKDKAAKAARDAGGAGEAIDVDASFGNSGEADDIVVADLTIQDPTSDGIKIEGAYGLVLKNVKAEWTRGPHPDNGAYALYPVLCDRVLMDGCVARGSSDAGVYVGQCRNVVVRNCRAEENVAGIEIENTVNADVYDNVATNNTGGMLVFSLPGLMLKNGRHCRVYNNKFFKNNLDNFAKPGNIVANIPPGTGMLLMANDQVEVFNNTFEDNMTFNLAIINYMTTGNPVQDPGYDPYPESIYVHDNTFVGGGDQPQRELGQLAASQLGGTVPDIVYDGWADATKLVDGQLPAELRLYIRNNGEADFVNLDAQALAKNQTPNLSQDLAPHDGELPPLEAVVGVE